MITVMCVWVRGNVFYDRSYVLKLKSAVARHLSSPHQFVCLTDQPSELLGEMNCLRIEAPMPLPGWWAKINLFDPALGSVGRKMYLDLDTLPVDSLDDIALIDKSFAIVPTAGTFEGRNGLRVVKKYNSSVMVWDGDAGDDIFRLWTPSVARSLWGDQDWIAQVMPDLHTMPLEWFPRISELSVDPMKSRKERFGEARVVLCKKPKNLEAAVRWQWFQDEWR